MKSLDQKMDKIIEMLANDKEAIDSARRITL